MGKLIRQLIRFGITGGLAFAIDYAAAIFLTEVVKVNYLAASTISFSLAVTFNYILSIYWVFVPSERKNRRVTILLFWLFSIIGLAINDLLIWALVEWIGLHYITAKFLATGVVMVFNFITRKRFIE